MTEDEKADLTFNDKLVLIIEDEPFTRDMIAKMVERIGPKVLTAEDGQSGYQICLEKKPDAVICDIAMKPVNGLQFLTRVRTDQAFFNNELPVVILTNASDASIVQKAKALKADGYLVKPISPKSMIQRLQAIFRV